MDVNRRRGTSGSRSIEAALREAEAAAGPEPPKRPARVTIIAVLLIVQGVATIWALDDYVDALQDTSPPASLWSAHTGDEPTSGEDPLPHVEERPPPLPDGARLGITYLLAMGLLRIFAGTFLFTGHRRALAMALTIGALQAASGALGLLVTTSARVASAMPPWLSTLVDKWVISLLWAAILLHTFTRPAVRELYVAATARRAADAPV